jgi:hypothetical protein
MFQAIQYRMPGRPDGKAASVTQTTGGMLVQFAAAAAAIEGLPTEATADREARQ